MSRQHFSSSMASMSYFKANQYFVQQTAEAIAAVVEFEVAIIDNNLEVIAGTGCYKDQIGTVYGEGSITSRLLRMGGYCILENAPLVSAICRNCSFRQKCTLTGGLTFSIPLEEKVIGTISLYAFTESQRQNLLLNQDKLLSFLNKIALLMSSKIHESEMNGLLTLMTNQLGAVMDSIVEGIIAVDKEGIVNQINKAAEKLLFVRASQILGVPLNELFPGLAIPKVLELGQPYVEQEILYKSREQNLQFIGTMTPIKLEGKIAGMVISLRSVRDVRKLAGRLIREERKYTLDGILGTSESITELKHKMQLVAATDSTVLITGESGTGKELFARAIHGESYRKNGPFIAINCGAIPDALLESELFGYEEGAFTGAVRGGKPGKFELADRGTLFLDEIGDMPLPLQVKLLRVLQELKIERIGGVKPTWVDVRIIAATNRNLEEMITRGEFRSDLFYRLSVIPFNIPPLRERKEDLTLLLYHFLDKYNLILNKHVTGLSPSVQEKMLAYPWPGNVRELENAVEYAINVAAGNYIEESCIPFRVREYFTKNTGSFADDDISTINELEKKAIMAALRKFGTTGPAKEKAAQSLGMSRSTFYRKIKELGLMEEFESVMTQDSWR
ncbi:sigma-54 interaction domain-containing protein [Acididesulfobacillus acetoxydans]|uniref:sigma-54 interaction domain-containing protein n=1 Tax=Acididesulfobacillus acetoxydans TaxID=1561005 RepID=UPI001F10A90A|nr:sigma 54-interacting transcriptional regulator [Acididesulfobacillus acetoxydans]